MPEYPRAAVLSLWQCFIEDWGSSEGCRESHISPTITLGLEREPWNDNEIWPWLGGRKRTGSKEGQLSLPGSLQGLCFKSETDAQQTPAAHCQRVEVKRRGYVARRKSSERGRPLVADISLKEQGEIRALQEGKSLNSARTLASLSCQVDGRPRNMTWSYCRGQGWWYKNYSTWIIAGSIGRQSHYRGARVQCLPWAAHGNSYLSPWQCVTHTTHRWGAVYLYFACCSYFQSYLFQLYRLLKPHGGWGRALWMPVCASWPPFLCNFPPVKDVSTNARLQVN